MDTYCRFCGEEKENLTLVGTLSPLIIFWLAKILDMENINLPNKMCYTCMCTIEDINYFLEKCTKSCEKFNKLLKSRSMDNEVKMDIEDREEMNEEYLMENESYIEKNEEFSQSNCSTIEYYETENIESEPLIELKKFGTDINEKKFKESPKCLIGSKEFSSNKVKSVHPTAHMSKNKLQKYNYKCPFCKFECNDREKIAYHMKRGHLNNNKNALFKDLLAIVIDQRKKVLYKKITNSIQNNLSHEFSLLDSVIENEKRESTANIEGNKNNVYENNIDYIKMLNIADVYVCKICKINFSKKTSFNKHWDALHLSEEEKELRRQKYKDRDQYLCPECGKSLPSAFKLDYHIRMHRNDRQYRCTLCPKSYVSKGHLETHMHRHTGNESFKMYSCEICGTKCRSPSELKVHQRFHRNERPFQCEYCERAFYLKSHLQAHVKGHLNDRTYICEEPGCTQSYRDKNAFRRHKDSHLADEEKSYECDICKNKFSTFGIMKDHRRKSHNKKHKQNPLDKNNFIKTTEL